MTVTMTATGQSIATVFGTQTVTSPTTMVTPATAFTTIATTVVGVVTEVVTSTLVTVAQQAPSGNAYCSNGQPVDGLSPPCTNAGCFATNLRIEGASDTVYEGPILNGPRNVTTASGGTHLCDGTNSGANPTPFANGISSIDAAAGLCNFTYDGTYDSSFQDFFITRIGASDSSSNSNKFWGILSNFVFTPTGGCQYETRNTDELLWAFDAFNAQSFLQVQPAQVTLRQGEVQVFTVTGADGNGNSSPQDGALFNNVPSNANGQVVFVASQTGTFRYKATKSGSIRSNAVTITVTN